jgi:hypothetical protein
MPIVFRSNKALFGAAVAALLLALGLAAQPARAAPTLLTDGNGLLLGANNVLVDGTLYDVRFSDSSFTDLFLGGSPPPTLNLDRDAPVPTFGALDSLVFTDLESATLASQALLDQVLLDVAGQLFDSGIQQVVGCTGGGTACSFMTAYTYRPAYRRCRADVGGGCLEVPFTGQILYGPTTGSAARGVAVQNLSGMADDFVFGDTNAFINPQYVDCTPPLSGFRELILCGNGPYTGPDETYAVWSFAAGAPTPVAEPGTLAIALLGLSMLGATRRRQRSEPAVKAL